MNSRHFRSAACLACLLALPAAAEAQGRYGPPPEQSMSVDQDRAASIARRATGGRVLGVKPDSGSQRVKILSRDGRVRVLRVDPRTGTVRP
jgi:hypothetical protein